MNAVYLMAEAALNVVLHSGHHRNRSRVPGEAYKRLPESVREGLGGLTSDGLKSVRLDVVREVLSMAEPSLNDGLRVAKEAFDREMGWNR